ncbi:ribonuclease H-like domain-containing protein [Tanacetum coccineum]
MVPRVVLMKSDLVSINIARQNISKTAVLVNTARQVNTAHSKTTVNAARPMSNLSKKAHSTVKIPIHKNTAFKNSNINQRVNTIRDKYFNTARPKAVVNAIKGNNLNAVKASACWVWKPKHKVLDHLIDKSQVLLRVPRKNNMYSVDLKNIVPKGGLTCLFVKATSDESKLWHRRLGHLNFKTMNKLVKGNLVRGLPSKLFENDQTCVACQKGKQHRASCKFDGKADEVFFVGYSLNRKAFRVFNIRTRIVEKNSNIRYTDYGLLGTKASDNAGQARKETEPVKDYILLPLWIVDPPFSQDPKSSHDDGFKPSTNDEKKVNEDPRKDSKCKDQEKEDNEEPNKVIHALKDPSWIEAMQEELLQFKLQEVWTLVDLPNGKRAIGSK